MKKILFAAFTLTVFALGACSDIDNIAPQSGTLLKDQLQESSNADPTRADAIFNGMYTLLGKPSSVLNTNRADNFGFISSDFSNDIETGDIVLSDNDYNWFSVCGELTSRSANYWNPIIRYSCIYNEISAAHDVMNAYPADSENPDIQAKIGQAYAIRAFCYLRLAPYYQFRYAIAKDEPCVPIVTLETKDFANNPRASVKDVYDLIISDLTIAIEKLNDYVRPNKSFIDKQVALGLRARAYLYMEEWDKALVDAREAMTGYTPATISELSKPSFMSITEHNWLWGYDMTIDVAQIFRYATSSSWIRSFSEYGYSAGTATYARLNDILYTLIPSTDVRKGWWVDENLESPLLEGLTWRNLSGQDIASGKINVEGELLKDVFDPYTNVKFGTNPIGTTNNEEDWPFMRVEEMKLIEIECLAKGGDAPAATLALNNFIKQYRDPSYDCATALVTGGRTLEDEIWFQRRIELWGEGLANPDVRRLGKPMVRFTNAATSIVPDNFRFNMAADDGWWLLRFTNSEKNTNLAIVDNEGGSIPTSGQHPELRDGVTK